MCELQGQAESAELLLVSTCVSEAHTVSNQSFEIVKDIIENCPQLVSIFPVEGRRSTRSNDSVDHLICNIDAIDEGETLEARLTSDEPCHAHSK